MSKRGVNVNDLLGWLSFWCNARQSFSIHRITHPYSALRHLLFAFLHVRCWNNHPEISALEPVHISSLNFCLIFRTMQIRKFLAVSQLTLSLHPHQLPVVRKNTRRKKAHDFIRFLEIGRSKERRRKKMV